MSLTNDRRPFASLGQKPPMQHQTTTGLDSAALSNLTGKAQAPSKWSINIQEIVKRTQKNLERGPSSSKATAGARVASSDVAGSAAAVTTGAIDSLHSRGAATTLQYLSKHMKTGFGSSSTKDKSSLLYHDLKKKLSYESGPQETTEISAVLRRKDNLLGLAAQSSSKAMRPTSVNHASGNISSAQIGAKSLYLVNQKTSAVSGGVVGQNQGLQERLAIARLKRRSNEEIAIDSYSQEGTANNGLRRQSSHIAAQSSANEVSATTSSIQGTQGGGEMYEQPQLQQHLSIEERAINHQRTLMQAGRLNLICATGSSNQQLLQQQQYQQLEDEEAQFIDGFPKNQFRRHNSNMNRPSNINLAIQDQSQEQHQLIQDLDIDDSQQAIIAEACMTEEQTQRNNAVAQNQNTSMERLGPLMECSLEEPTVRTSNNFMTDGGRRGELLKMNHLRPSNSTGGGAGTQPIMIGTSSFTDTQNKRQVNDLKTRLVNQRVNSTSATHQQHGTSKSGTSYDVAHRQKIFEEEIIKRIKEIQRYVKSLHLQIKKTQGSHEKLKEEVEIDKDVLVSLQQTQELQNKKYQNDRLKQVSMGELEGSMKDLELRYNEKLVLVVQEAADQTLKQVNNDIIPEARLKMYDSITEETNRLKLDLEYQLQSFKRELGDITKKDRMKSSEIIEKEILSLRNELTTEQSTQTLSILAQVDGQIAKAIKEARVSNHSSEHQLSISKQEMQRVRSEAQEQIEASENRIIQNLQQEMLSAREQSTKELQQKLADLDKRMSQRLSKSQKSLSTNFITPELLSEKLLAIKQDVVKSGQRDLKKALESQKSHFVQIELLQTEIQKVNQSLKTSLEEAKFDTVQMIQSDIVELSNQQKDTRFKASDLQNKVDEVRGQVQETIQRMTTREKEQTSLQMRTSQLQEQQTSFENKLETLGAEIREIEAREARSPLKSATPVKQEAYDSHRSAPNAFALEELESLRQELKEVSDHCNVNQSLVEETKMEVSNNKSSSDKQLKAIKGQIDEVSKQVIDVQFESGQNKQFLEDQLAELTQSTEALQDRIIENKDAQVKEVASLKSELQKLDQSCERQFANLHNGVHLLEDWQAKVKETLQAQEISSSAQKQCTMHTDQASVKDEQTEAALSALEQQLQSHVAQMQEQGDQIRQHSQSLESFNVNIGELSGQIESLEQQIEENENSRNASDEANSKQVQQVQQEHHESLSTEIGSLQAMLSTLSERNKKLEDDFAICLTQLQVQSTTIEKIEATSREDNQGISIADEQKIVAKCQAEIAHCKTEIIGQIEQLSQRGHDCGAVIEELKVHMASLEDKIESLEKQTSEVLISQQQMQQSRPKSISQQSSSQAAKWQESAVKKVTATKQASGWGEIRMTKIEARDSSLQMVNASATSTMLRSKPPQIESQNSAISNSEQKQLQNPFEKAGEPSQLQILDDREEEKMTVESHLAKNSKPNSSQDQALSNSQSQTHQQQPTLQSMSFDHDEEEDEDHQYENNKEAVQKQGVTCNEEVDDKTASDHVVEQTKDARIAEVTNVTQEDDMSGLCGGIGRPTEYSASVNETVQENINTKRGNETNMGELEIKSPVQFDMMPDSDVKIDTNSSQANLLIQDRIAFDVDDNNLNDQIISPSEGIQVPNTAEFYKLQREFRSNQVQKKNDMLTMIKSQAEQEIESEKLESPRPLNADLQNNKDEDNSQVEDEISQKEKQNQAPVLESSDSGLLLQSQSFKKGKLGGKTAAHLDLDFGGEPGDDAQLLKKKSKYQPLNEGTHLFRTQKMSGLAQLSHKATHQHALEGLDAHDLELQQKLEEEASAFEASSDQQLTDSQKIFELEAALDSNVDEGEETDSKKLLPPSESGAGEEELDNEDVDDDMIDGLPASSIVLGMRLNKAGAGGLARDSEDGGSFSGMHGLRMMNAGHERINSDGKSSSIMGLSALGLESHRESNLELASDNLNGIECSAEKLLLQSAVSTCNEEDKALEAEMKGMLLGEKRGSLDSQDANREQMVLGVVSALVQLEIEQALGIMQELQHPNVCTFEEENNSSRSQSPSSLK